MDAREEKPSALREKSRILFLTTAGVIALTSTSRPHTKLLRHHLLAMALRENFLISLRYIKNFSLRLLPADGVSNFVVCGRDAEVSDF